MFKDAGHRFSFLFRTADMHFIAADKNLGFGLFFDFQQVGVALTQHRRAVGAQR